MGYVDREIISELKTMIASSYDLSLALTLSFGRAVAAQRIGKECQKLTYRCTNKYW